MGSALMQGALQANALRTGDVLAYDEVGAALLSFAKETGATAADSLPGLVGAADTLILCTKPADVPAVLRAISAVTDGKSRLLISVAAGVTVAAMEAALPASVRVIRSMPNTPALVGKGAAAFCRGSRATAEDAALAAQILGSVGIALELPEKLMDAVTGLSGSGPAFGFLIIEALADGGVRAGLPRADALRLAAQTMLGAAAMVLETGLHPADLKDRVASPGGTTIAGLAELERRGLRGALIDAVTIAAQRSAELGRNA
jgi:pyrroline-5-carboxylate reductase